MSFGFFLSLSLILFALQPSSLLFSLSSPSFSQARMNSTNARVRAFVFSQRKEGEAKEREREQSKSSGPRERQRASKEAAKRFRWIDRCQSISIQEEGKKLLLLFSSPEQPRVVRQLPPLGQAQRLPLRGVQEGLGGVRAGPEEREQESDDHRRDGDGDLDRWHLVFSFLFFLSLSIASSSNRKIPASSELLIPMWMERENVARPR